METDYTVAYVGLGSNLGYRSGNLLMAVRGVDGGELCGIAALGHL
jgi:7,8-dihydro-6-hydroxymethylpterin-pyrophosphokinase